MTNSQNNTSKCLSGILRGLLCTGSLPTHPSGSISTEPNNTTNNPEKHSRNEVVKPQVPPTPGIVARLMGLDTLPDFKGAQNRTSLDSILRSRSVNYFPQFDTTQFNHRRVRTSVSFREENATLLRRRESDFVVFRFENVGESSKLSFGRGKSEMCLEVSQKKQGKIGAEKNRGDLAERNRGDLEDREIQMKKVVSERGKEHNYYVNLRFCSKVGNVNLPNKIKSEMGLEELKQRKVEPERSRGNLGERKFEKKKGFLDGIGEKKKVRIGKCYLKVDNVDLIRKNKVVVGKTQETVKGKSGVKAVNNKEIVSLKNKKNSVSKHPDKTVSVADLHHIFPRHEITSSGDSRVTIPKLMEFSSPSIADQVFVSEDYLKPNKRRKEEKHRSELLIEILRLTEEGMEESKWIGEKVLNFKDVEEICTELGQQILDLLFSQVIHGLVGCHMNKFM